MGDPSPLLRKQAPKTNDLSQQDAVQMKTGQVPPAFAVTASPVQMKEPKEAKSKVTKTEKEIAAKKAELDGDISIIKPGESWNKSNREDKAITDAAAKRFGVKREKKLYSPTLCGKKINNMNTLVKDKIDKVNVAFAKLTPAEQQEITESLQSVGGYNYRVMSKASSMDRELAAYGLTGYRRLNISDHAFGCAMDINANVGTKQNTHWTRPEKKLKGEKALPKADRLLLFMQSIIQKYDSSFDLDKSTGVDQLKGINSFTDHLCTYVNELVGNTTQVNIFTEEADIKKRLAECKTDTDNCKVILNNWETFKGYDKGTRLEKVEVTTGKGKKKKTKKVEQVTVLNDDSDFDRSNSETMDLKGVVDLNETFTKMMLEAGWQWGGDYDAGNKDYMHFEDTAAMAAMKTAEPTE